MRKRFALILMLLLLTGAGRAFGESGLAFVSVPEVLHPGKAERISFYAPTEGEAQITLEGAGQTLTLVSGYRASAGNNHITLTGDFGEVSEGDRELVLTLGEDAAAVPVKIGVPVPRILSFSAPEEARIGDTVSFALCATQGGAAEIRVCVGDEWKTAAVGEIPADAETHISWDSRAMAAELTPGTLLVRAVVTDAEGLAGAVRQISLLLAPAPTPAPSPTPYIPSAVARMEEENSYWTLPIGNREDEQAIWDVMMQPMTVIDGNEKEVYRLRRTPDDSSKKDNVVGEITYASQGVHILETLDNGWTLVEAYNSSYGPNCKSRPGYGVTDDLIQGYVKTSLLKTVQPAADYALLIDKLNQRMYIFNEGKIIGELLVSTGLNNATQSWNETPSGEFVIISPKMGGFPAGNLWCEYGMRLNGGCAIHQVPYIGDADTPASRQDFSSTAKLLGSKASHGCIRVQKTLNEQGQNMKWLWNNLKKYTKVLIWDDTGRAIPYPDDDIRVYYNPTGGKYFHLNQYCSSVKDRYLPLTETTYGQLEALFETPKACPRCATTLMTKAEIDAINESLKPRTEMK